MTARSSDFKPVETWFTLPRILPEVPSLNAEDELQGYRVATLREVMSLFDQDVFIHAHANTTHHLETIDKFPLIWATKKKVERYENDDCNYKIFLDSALGERVYFLERTLESLKDESLLETCVSYYMMAVGGTQGRFRVMMYKKNI